MVDLSEADVEGLDDEEGTVYLWRIPEEWSAEKVDALGDEISPRFDEAFHLFADDGLTVEEVTDRVEIAESTDIEEHLLPTSVAAYHDDLFRSICEHLGEQDEVSDGTRVEELSLKVAADEPIAVTNVVEAADE